jgi:hypothetical protein
MDQILVQNAGQGMDDQPWWQSTIQKSRFLSQNVNQGDTIAVVDAGYIAYTMPPDVRVIDMVGLSNGHIAHLPVQLPHGLWGTGDAFGKWDVDYVLSQKPRYVQITVFTGARLLAQDPRFQALYRPITYDLYERIEPR